MELRFGSYRLRVRERQLIGPGGPLDIDGRALDVLRALLARPNELVLKDEIFAAVWPGLVVGEDPALDAKRFRRTDKGVCLITQRMIDAL